MTDGAALTPLESSCQVDSVVTALDVSPSTDVVAVADSDGAVQLLRPSSDNGGLSGIGSPLGGPVELPACCLRTRVRRSGDKLATGGADQQVTIWSVRPENDVPLKGSPSSIRHTNAITALAFSPDASVLAVGDGDGSACTWDAERLRSVGSCLTARYAPSRSVIDALAFSPDGDTLFTGGRLNPTVAWDSVLWVDPEAEPKVGSRQIDLMCQLAGNKNLTAGAVEPRVRGDAARRRSPRNLPHLSVHRTSGEYGPGMVPGPAPTSVDFHFDIMCPYAFQTSWWIREVRDHAGVTVNWRFFSLEEINRLEGKKHPWEREWSYGWSMMRIGALLRRDDPALLDAWYAKAGTALHVDGRKPHRPEVAQRAAGGDRPRPRPGRPGDRGSDHDRRGEGGPRLRRRPWGVGRPDPGLRRRPVLLRPGGRPSADR